MTTTYFPTWRVDGPPPIAPPFGLLQAASADAAGVRIVVDVDARPADAPGTAGLVPAGAGQERWVGGIAVWPYPPGTPGVWGGCGIGSPGPGQKDFGEAPTPPEFAAFTVYEPITCTAFQIPDQAEFRARAARVLDAVQGFAVEQEFMAGGLNDASPHLTDSEADILNGGTAVKPNYGIQLLEEQIALTGRLGIIHCSPMLATALLGSGFALSDKSGVIRTINGNPVIPGGGYVGVSKPVNGSDPGVTEEWAYATGPVDIRQSAMFTTPETLGEALDRGMGATNDRPNTITYRAERYFAVDWDTVLQSAVLIDRCSSDCNPAS